VYNHAGYARRKAEDCLRLAGEGLVIEYEWDPEKAEENERKHGISFHEAATVFGDRLAITFADPDHSIDEHRYLTFALSRFDKLLVVSHADNGDKIRVISARLMTRRERRIYEEGQDG